MEKGPERYKNWGREGGKREGWKEGGRGERKKGTELFYLAALPYSKHYVLGGDIKPYIWNAAKKKKKKEGAIWVSLVHFLCWNTDLEHLKRKRSQSWKISSFSRLFPQKLFMSQCPLEYGREGTPNVPPLTPYSWLVFLTMGRGGRERKDWKILKQSQKLLKSCHWPGERRISRNDFRFISDS